MQNELNPVLNPIAQALSIDQLTDFTEMGELMGLCASDIEAQLTRFYNAVMVEVTKDINGVLTTVKEPDYYLWEQGSHAWQKGYATGKKIAYLMNDGKINPSLTLAFHKFAKDIGDKFAISKPAKPTTTGQAKAEQRSKSAIAKEQLMAMSFENLEKQKNDLQVNGSKDSIKQALKIAEAIEAKQKANQKAIDEIWKIKHKTIKDLLVKCHDTQALDSIIEQLQEYQGIESVM
jgi:hypothetical protein